MKRRAHRTEALPWAAMRFVGEVGAMHSTLGISLLLVVAILLLPVMVGWRHFFLKMKKTGKASIWLWVISAVGLLLAAIGAILVQFF
jgi:hypothetical protein